MANLNLEVKNLTKNFGKFRAVDSISFTVPKGKIIGLLGPNGAGKTTTIQMLIGITTPTAGTIKYFGRDFSKNKEYCLSKINFASAFNTLQGRISVRENLVVFARLYGIKSPDKKIKELANYFEIEDLLPQSYSELSSGQKTRVNLIKSLINDPEIILLDEPTASLDPDISDKTLSLIENLKKEKDLSILFTSHEMDEVTRLCDEVIFLDRGKIVAQDTPLGLTKRIPFAKLKIVFEGEQETAEKYLRKTKKVYKFLRKNSVTMDLDESIIPETIFELNTLDISITDIEIAKPTLEDVFLQIARGGKNES